MPKIYIRKKGQSLILNDSILITFDQFDHSNSGRIRIRIDSSPDFPLRIEKYEKKFGNNLPRTESEKFPIKQEAPKPQKPVKQQKDKKVWTQKPHKGKSMHTQQDMQSPSKNQTTGSSKRPITIIIKKRRSYTNDNPK